MPNRGTSSIVGGSDITFRRGRRVVINLSVRLASFIYITSCCLAIFLLLHPTLNPSTANKTRPLAHLLTPESGRRCAPSVSSCLQHNTTWAHCPERITAMFGQMTVEPVVQLDPGVDLQTAIATLTKVAENVEIVRWIELPASVLLFLLVPGDPDSGAVYVLDRKTGTWYAVDFEDEQFGGYSVIQLEMLLKDCNFLDLIERPGLWRTGLRWVVLPGELPEAAV